MGSSEICSWQGCRVIRWRFSENHFIDRRTSTTRKHCCGMRRLSPHRFSRSLQIRQWTCAQCLLQKQTIRRSSSISSAPKLHLLDLNNGSSSSVARDQADSDADHKKPRQGHPRNTGKYFVTTPIFYVNGGTPLIYGT